MSKRRSRRQKESIVKWYHFALLLLTGLLMLSFFQNHSPQTAISNIYHNTLGDSTKIIYQPTELEAQKERMQQSIDSLQQVIFDLENSSPYTKVMIDVESSSVNLRSAATISSEVIMRIPDSTMVDVVSYDTEVYVWEGQSGKWAKISYADTTGWVWGNYLSTPK